MELPRYFVSLRLITNRHMEDSSERDGGFVFSVFSVFSLSLLPFYTKYDRLMKLLSQGSRNICRHGMRIANLA